MAQADEGIYRPLQQAVDFSRAALSEDAPTPEVAEGPASPAVGDDAGEKASAGARRARPNPLIEWALIVVVALTAALLIKAFAVQAFFIPSASMEPTLFPGDRVLVNKLSYDVHRVNTGDVIVFRRPPADNSSDVGDLIKRVIALPGQTIYVSNCRVYIDGKQLSQPYLPRGWQHSGSEYCTTWVDGPGTANLPNPYRVPQGDYFVMGDNRTDSDDSRYWGPLPGRYIVGRAFLKMWPPRHLGFL